MYISQKISAFVFCLDICFAIVNDYRHDYYHQIIWHWLLYIKWIKKDLFVIMQMCFSNYPLLPCETILLIIPQCSSCDLINEMICMIYIYLKMRIFDDLKMKDSVNILVILGKEVISLKRRFSHLDILYAF